MRFSKRGRRRLVVVAVLILGLGGAGFAFHVIRANQQARLYAQARADGMAAYEASDYETAIERLSYFLQNERRDLDVVLAFAEARTKVPMVNGRHIRDAIDLYRHGLNLLDEMPPSAERDARERDVALALRSAR